MGEREGMTCSKETQGRIEPRVTAGRTQPLYMGHLRYQLSYQGTLSLCSLTFAANCLSKYLDIII